jgi:hypothetical protein
MPSLANLQAGMICALPSDELKYNVIMNIWRDITPQPNAYRHLYHYRHGKGAIYTEDVNQLFSGNPRVAFRIAGLIDEQIRAGAGRSGTIVGKGVDDDTTPPIRQSDYDSDDWKNANGNIDTVNWTLTGTYNPRSQNTFIITVIDPYTWHPFEKRPTQCIHQAMERLKNDGAADYTTIGTGVITLPAPAFGPDLPIPSVF